MLVVEDDPDVAEVLRSFLEEAEHPVECAAAAADAICHLDGQPPDVVLIDCHLPGGGAGEVMAQADAAGSAVVLMSGDAEILAELAAFGYPCLSKPFSLGDLVTAIDATVIDRARRTARPGTPAACESALKRDPTWFVIGATPRAGGAIRRAGRGSG